MNADGPKPGEGTTPPLREETNYIVYGQRCIEGNGPQLVAQRVEVLNPAAVNISAIIAKTGMYGDMPVQIVTATD